MKTIFTFFAFFLFVTPAYAARFVVEMPRDLVAPEGEFIAYVFLDTEGESLNAFEGQLAFPADLLEVESVRSGSSIVTLWLTAPAQDADAVVFSGITPGGYNGEHGRLFSVVFRAKEEGIGMLSLRNLQALKNDGNGTPAHLSSVSSEFLASKQAKTTKLPNMADIEPPEPFAIQMARTPAAFDRKNVIIFMAQDKGSGVSRYEVCEGIFAACTSSESPYILHRQPGDAFITVRAVDNAGNIRTEHLLTSNAVVRYALYGILAVLICVGALFAGIRFKRNYLR